MIYLDGVMAVIENVPTADTEGHGGQMNNWISVKDTLPEPPEMEGATNNEV